MSANLPSFVLTSFILISDIGMLDIDGYQLMPQVRSLPSEKGGQIHAIALTTYAGELDFRRAQAVGLQRHIAKPVAPHFLISSIAATLHEPSTHWFTMRVKRLTFPNLRYSLFL